MRLPYTKISPDAYSAVLPLPKYFETGSAIDQKLRHLVEMRVSQVNGCGYCLAMHARQLRSHGETQFRLDVLSAWAEVDVFTDREKAALAWAEAITLVAEGHVSDDVYDLARAEFSEKELVDLTYIVATMNLWNRLAITFRSDPTPG